MTALRDAGGEAERKRCLWCASTHCRPPGLPHASRSYSALRAIRHRAWTKPRVGQTDAPLPRAMR